MPNNPAYVSMSHPYSLIAFVANFYSAYVNGDNDYNRRIIGGNGIGFMSAIYILTELNINPRYLKIGGVTSLIAIPYLEDLSTRILAAAIIGGGSIFLGAFNIAHFAARQFQRNPSRPNQQIIGEETHGALGLGLILIFISAIHGYICGRVLYNLS